MNNSELRRILRALTEQKMPAANINLWPKIRSHVQLGDRKTMKGNLMNKKQTRWQVKPAYILAAVLLIAALTMAFPQGRAWAQQLLYFFHRGESNAMPGVTVTPLKWVEQTPGVAAATPLPPQLTVAGPEFEAVCGSQTTPHCTLDEIRSMVAFPVYALAELPEGMHFAGATGGPQQVHLFYQAPDQSGWLSIQERPFTGEEPLLSIEVGADAEIQTMQVGQAQAEYVKGSYDGNQNPPVWNSDLGLQELRWVDGGILFSVMTHSPKLSLEAADLVALAGTLTDGPVSAEAAELFPALTSGSSEEDFDPQRYYPLTLDQAAEAAAFTPLLPASLPEGLTFIGGRFNAETGVAEFLYHADAMNSVLIREQIALEGVDCDLCGFVQGNGRQVEGYPQGKLVSVDAVIEVVEVNGLSSNYVEGIGWTSRAEEGGWQWDTDPFVKRLRLHSGELAIEVVAYTYELSKEDLTTIAAGLK